MSGSRFPHLQRRNGMYHLRVRVPDHIRPRIGQGEVHRSLGTYVPRIARILAVTYSARVMGVFDMIASTDLTKTQARQLVASCFHDLVRETEAVGGFMPETTEPDIEIDEQRHLASARIVELRDQCVTRRYAGDVKEAARRLWTTSALASADMSKPDEIDLCEGVARALIEQQRLFLLRLEDRLAPFEPTDPIFASSAPQTTTDFGSAGNATGADFRGVSVEEAINDYLRYGEKIWVMKTAVARRWQLRYLIEHLGGDRPLSSITVHDIRTFRDAVLTLRKNHGRSPSHSFLHKQTDNAAHRIAPKTASVIYEPCQAFFRWCKSVQGLIDKNPAEDIRMVIIGKDKATRTRRPFRENELHRLFGSPLWTGCHSLNRRYRAGTKIFQDAKFWIPILGYYTGARLGELVQLHFADVRLDDQFPCISINEENEAGAASKKHVKSMAGIRTVPIHPDIMALGFAAFVARRRKGSKSSDRLFPEFPYGSDGQASTVFSKFFARLLDAVGLNDPALVFHSFRHGAQDAFRDALTPQYVTDKIIGHHDGATSSSYGMGVSLDVAASAMAAAKFKVRLPEILRDNRNAGS
ncbi:DUF6538 domain-containing protein [Blastomonas fulva]|uniref:DUF6538 domain-containing protein n=1 Tax=Blastomonas fulva TaxID=1550728 RepID=UPI003F72F484